MRIEKDEHDRYAKVGKTIYGTEDPRRWSDECICGGTRADHVIMDPTSLYAPTPAQVSNNNHDGGCEQFTPTNHRLGYARLKVITTEDED